MKTMFAWLISLMFLGSGLAYAAGDYTNSAHGNSTSGVERTDYPTASEPYAKGNCAHCHEQHASVGGDEPVPDSPAGPDEYLLFQDYKDDSYNSFCIDKCHRAVGSWGGDDIASQYSKASTHPTTGTHTPAESTAADFGVRHGYCIDCHNPHVAKKIDRTVGSNLVSGGPLLNVSGVSVTNSTAWTAPSYAFISASTGITKEYELCFKCHSSWPSPSPPSGADAAKEFNPANASYHPVEAALTGGGSSALDADQMLAPWKVGAGTDTQGTKTMYCSDCHGDDAASPPAGPHGSGSPKILKGRWPVNSSSYKWTLADADATKANSFDTECLCLNCHPVYATGWKNNVHSYGSHINYECVDCHVGVPHGYKWKRLIADRADLAPYNYGGVEARVTAYIYKADPNSYVENDCTAYSCGGGAIH